MQTKSKKTRNYLIATASGFLACCLLVCVLGAFLPDPVSAPAELVPIETVIVGTSNAARAQTLAVTTVTRAPTLAAPPSPTSVVLPARTPFPTSDILSGIPRAACVPNRPPQTGAVTDVVDGDTIKVRLDQDGLTYPVRYIGIDTPESTIQHEPFGKEASVKNAELVAGKRVYLFKDVSETDKYNRLLRYVFADGLFVNYELVKQGFANAVTYPPDVSCADTFREGEGYARSLLLGFWALQPQATDVTLPTSSAQKTVIITAVNKQSEYVDIKNVGSTPINLQGWTLVSEKGNQACSLGGILEPGATLRIWAGASTSGFSCGFGSPIWNNSESDPAVLLDPQGQEVDRYG